MTELHRRPPFVPPNGPGASEDGVDPAAASAQSHEEPGACEQYANRCGESPRFAQLGLAGDGRAAPGKPRKEQAR